MKKLSIVATVIHSKAKSHMAGTVSRVIVSCDGKQVGHADLGGKYTVEQGLAEFRKNRSRFKLTAYGNTLPVLV